jgi:putative nucleotidyltransferase with HDIG domain
VLAKSLGSEKPYTREHGDDVARYAAEIAKALNLSEEEQETIANTALFHDIGKIAVQDKILNKNGSLDEEEKKEIRKHPQIGAKILGCLKLLHIERSAILYHHEYFDGSGYPEGLKGEQIPLLARILAVADAYSAMVSDRPYRKAIDKLTAAKELIRGSGKQFDPQIVEVFLKILNTQANAAEKQGERQ